MCCTVRRVLILCAVLYCACYLGLAEIHFEDVDVLQRLGLAARRSPAASAGLRVLPQGVIPLKSGVFLTQQVQIRVPVGSIIPMTFGTSLCLVLSLCSYRLNNAYFFSVVSKDKKLLLGIQFVTGKIIVHLGEQKSVYLDYNIHNSKWDNLAIEIQEHKVILHTSCGKKRVYADLHFTKEASLDPEGSFFLGKMNPNSIQFEGALCQFDIYHSSKAAHNYCKYIRKECMEAETCWPVLQTLIPLLQKDNSEAKATPVFFTDAVDVSLALTQDGTKDKYRLSRGPTTLLNSTLFQDSLLTHNPATTSLPSHSTVALDTARPSLQYVTQNQGHMVPELVTIGGPLSTITGQKSGKQTFTSGTRDLTPRQDAKTSGSEHEFINLSTFTPQAVQPESSSKIPDQNLQRCFKFGSFSPVTLPVDDYQPSTEKPTQFSPLPGPPGQKGEPGPPVSR
ncbi:collagen alpha-1(XXVII) chain B-like [Arapaima gigas]